MATITVVTTSHIQLSPEHLGVARISENPVGSLETANRLLQKNHDDHHMFWRDVAGHNHIAHSILSVLSMGGSPSELRRAYGDGEDTQRPIPPLDYQVVKEFSDPENFRARMGILDEYTNFLAFFEQKIEERGWKAVVQEYVFSRSTIAETMFANLFEGAYHPIIHLGLGIEFDQPSIIAEGLAQAAAHDSMGTETFLIRSEQKALRATKSSKPFLELLHDARANDAIHYAANFSDDGPARVRDGVLGRAAQEIEALAGRFRVKPQNLERGLAETINAAAFATGGAQRPGKARKIDFFHMHSVTASIMLTVLVREPWISIEDKVRLVEWKGRHDLVWYAASGAAELQIGNIVNYKPRASAGLDWNALYQATNKVHDDGHLAKLVRGLKNGEEVSKPFENGEGSELFPVKGEMWLRIAQMAYDSTWDLPVLEKWIWGVGFDENWAVIPPLEQS